MGAFNTFFRELWSVYIKTPITELKDALILKVAVPIKDALDKIFDVLEAIKTEVASIPTKIVNLGAAIVELDKTMNKWMLKKIGFDDATSGVLANLSILPLIKNMLSFSDPEQKRNITDTVGKSIQGGVKLVTDAALSNLTPIFEDFMEEQKIPEKDRENIRAIAGSGEFGLNSVVAFMLGHFLSPVLSTSLAPAWETMGQQAWKVLPNHLADVGTLIRLKYRGLITPEFYEDQLRKQGVGSEVQKAYEDNYRFYPAPTDLVMWLAKEVFEPDMIARYGLDAELPTGQLDLFEKAGVDISQMTNYWRAHWSHPAWTVVSELLHRGQMTEAEVYDWFRLVEIPPFWRQKMMNVSWAVPTRVDVRRFWDMRTIDEARMREIYEHRGYHGKDLDDYVLWTRVYTEFPSLMARYKNGWVTTEEVESELVALGMPPERAKTMIEEKIKKEAAGRTTKERDLTKAEIVKGVKKEVITLEQGQDLLEDMGYDTDEAEYILAINIEAASGSPETFWEFKKITELEKLAEGREGKRVPETLIEAEKKHRKHPEDMMLEVEYREEMKKWEGED